MTKRRGPSKKFVGSCGMYLAARDGGALFLLVHRRSRQVFEPNTISTPGGIVEREVCERAGQYDFELGARLTALKELAEETGVVLKPEESQTMQELPVDGKSAYWGAEQHRNFCVILDRFPPCPGPEKASKHEIVWEGLKGIGRPAGDNFSAWVEVNELLSRGDLMRGCTIPLNQLAGKVPSTAENFELTRAAAQPPAVSSRQSLAAAFAQARAVTLAARGGYGAPGGETPQAEALRAAAARSGADRMAAVRATYGQASGVYIANTAYGTCGTASGAASVRREQGDPTGEDLRGAAPHAGDSCYSALALAAASLRRARGLEHPDEPEAGAEKRPRLQPA